MAKRIIQLTSGKSLRLYLITVITFLLTGVGSCPPELSEICTARLPELTHDFTVAQSKIESEKAPVPVRMLASDFDDETRAVESVARRHHKDGDAAKAAADSAINRAEIYSDIPKEDRDAWDEWAESRIKEVQQYLDRANSRPDYRPIWRELSEVANQLVVFRGYSHVGNTYKMKLTLEHVREHGDQAMHLACAASAGAALPADEISRDPVGSVLEKRVKAAAAKKKLSQSSNVPAAR